MPIFWTTIRTRERKKSSKTNFRFTITIKIINPLKNTLCIALKELMNFSQFDKYPWKTEIIFIFSLSPHEPSTASYHRTPSRYHSSTPRSCYLKLQRSWRTWTDNHLVQGRHHFTDRSSRCEISSRSIARRKSLLPSGSAKQERIGRRCVLVWG